VTGQDIDLANMWSEGEGGDLFSLYQDSIFFMCMPVFLVMFYLLTKFIGCSVDPEISRSMCKLTQIPRL
jgi:hypothetical protein